MTPGSRPASGASHADGSDLVTDPNWHTCAVCGVRWQRFHECPSAPRSTSAPGFAGQPWTAQPSTVAGLACGCVLYNDVWAYCSQHGGGATTRPLITAGWQCPVCGVVYGPTIASCHNSHQPPEKAEVQMAYDLWMDVREVVLKAPCRHVDEVNSLACDNCIRIRRAVTAIL